MPRQRWPKDWTGPIPEPDLCLYHWSPRERRRSIERRGLVPGSISLDREWRPPYVAFSPNPSLAWDLSGRFHPEFELWDLWMIYADSDAVKGWELIPQLYRDSNRAYAKEYRVYQRVFKRHVIWVAERRVPPPVDG